MPAMEKGYFQWSASLKHIPGINQKVMIDYLKPKMWDWVPGN